MRRLSLPLLMFLTIAGITGCGSDESSSDEPSAPAIWALDQEGDRVFKIETSSGDVTEIAVGEQPTALAAGEQGVWVLEAGSISKIDPATDEVTEIDTGSTYDSIALGDDGVWLGATPPEIGEGYEIQKLDFESDEIVDTFPVEDDAPFKLEYVDGKVAYSGPDQDPPYNSPALNFLDPATGEITGVADVKDEVDEMVEVDGALWATPGLTPKAGLLEVDPATAEIVSELPESEPNQPGSLGAGEAGFWTSVGNPPEPATIDVAGPSVEVAGPPLTETFTGAKVAVADDAAWFVDNDGTAYEVNPETGEATQTVELPIDEGEEPLFVDVAYGG